MQGHSPLVSKERGKKAPAMSPPGDDSHLGSGGWAPSPLMGQWPRRACLWPQRPLALTRALSSAVASRVCLEGLRLAAVG